MLFSVRGRGKYHLSHHIGQESELDNVNLSDFMQSDSDVLLQSPDQEINQSEWKSCSKTEDFPLKCQLVMSFCLFCDNLKLLDMC